MVCSKVIGVEERDWIGLDWCMDVAFHSDGLFYLFEF